MLRVAYARYSTWGFISISAPSEATAVTTFSTSILRRRRDTGGGTDAGFACSWGAWPSKASAHSGRGNWSSEQPDSASTHAEFTNHRPNGIIEISFDHWSYPPRLAS